MIRTRIAPSPTGQDLHIGNLYTALINWAAAKKRKGQFVIRIEDTDRERYVSGAEEKIINSLKTYGLGHDEGPDIGGPYAPYRQSERLEFYKKFANELIEKKAAYYCICTKERLSQLRESQIKNKIKTKYDKHCLENQVSVKAEIAKGVSFVVRLDVKPDREIKFHDLIRGEISINSNEIDDQVLMKSDGYPTYHLGVVVDDHLMNITHVIRAEEWISSTPKHVLLYEAFGWDLPIFAHGPILRNTDKSKLSKRKNPVWAMWYIDAGYLPEAVLNYLALMGWSHPEQKDIFSMEEFVAVFELKDLKPVGPAFDIDKLTWMNQQYIQMKSDGELKKAICDFYPNARNMSEETLDKLIPLLKTRMQVLTDFEKLSGFFVSEPEIQLRSDLEKSVAAELAGELDSLGGWEKEKILEVFKKLLLAYKIKMPVLYYILTGAERGLPLPESLEILGRDETLKRLKKMLD